MYIDALMFMLMQCTYMTGKHLIFSPFAPDLASLSFLFKISQLQTIFWSLFCRFVMMTKHKKSELKIIESSENLPGNMQISALLPSPLMTPRPGRNVSPQRRMDGTSSACSPRALLVVRASLTPPSLSISLLTFPEKDGVEHALLREADLCDLYTNY